MGMVPPRSRKLGTGGTFHGPDDLSSGGKYYVYLRSQTLSMIRYLQWDCWEAELARKLCPYDAMSPRVRWSLEIEQVEQLLNITPTRYPMPLNKCPCWTILKRLQGGEGQNYSGRCPADVINEHRLSGKHMLVTVM